MTRGTATAAMAVALRRVVETQREWEQRGKLAHAQIVLGIMNSPDLQARYLKEMEARCQGIDAIRRAWDAAEKRIERGRGGPQGGGL